MPSTKLKQTGKKREPGWGSNLDPFEKRAFSI